MPVLYQATLTHGPWLPLCGAQELNGTVTAVCGAGAGSRVKNSLERKSLEDLIYKSQRFSWKIESAILSWLVVWNIFIFPYIWNNQPN